MAAQIPTIDEIEAVVRRLLKEELRAAQAESDPVLWSVKKAADRTGLSEATLRRRIRSGELPIKRVGARVLIPAEALRPESDAEVVELAHAARFRK
jgi:excisionase family DNA binding protein